MSCQGSAVLSLIMSCHHYANHNSKLYPAIYLSIFMFHYKNRKSKPPHSKNSPSGVGKLALCTFCDTPTPTDQHTANTFSALRRKKEKEKSAYINQAHWNCHFFILFHPWCITQSFACVGFLCGNQSLFWPIAAVCYSTEKAAAYCWCLGISYVFGQTWKSEQIKGMFSQLVV